MQCTVKLLWKVSLVLLKMQQPQLFFSSGFSNITETILHIHWTMKTFSINRVCSTAKGTCWITSVISNQGQQHKKACGCMCRDNGLRGKTECTWIGMNRSIKTHMTVKDKQYKQKPKSNKCIIYRWGLGPLRKKNVGSHDFSFSLKKHNTKLYI